jgi:hypothetical protein
LAVFTQQSVYEQFVETYPAEQIECPNYAQHCGRIVERFVSTGNVGKGKSTGRPTVATPDVVQKKLSRNIITFRYVGYPNKQVSIDK